MERENDQEPWHRRRADRHHRPDRHVQRARRVQLRRRGEPPRDDALQRLPGARHRGHGVLRDRHHAPHLRQGGGTLKHGVDMHVPHLPLDGADEHDPGVHGRRRLRAGQHDHQVHPVEHLRAAVRLLGRAQLRLGRASRRPSPHCFCCLVPSPEKTVGGRVGASGGVSGRWGFTC